MSRTRRVSLPPSTPEGNTRATGDLAISPPKTLRAHPKTPDRTDIELEPLGRAGAIVRNPNTGRWQYDGQLRANLKMSKDPDFPTDYDAGIGLGTFCVDLRFIHDLPWNRHVELSEVDH